MKSEMKNTIDSQLFFLNKEDKGRVISIFTNSLEPVLKDFNVLQTDKNSLERELNFLKSQVKSYSSEIDKLKNKNTELKNKIDFLNSEMKNKLSKNESKTIAFQLGNSIIQGVKNPKEGIKDLPSTATYLVKESIARRQKNNKASKLDRLLGIVLEDNNHHHSNTERLITTSNTDKDTHSNSTYNDLIKKEQVSSLYKSSVEKIFISKEKYFEINKDIDSSSNCFFTVNCYSEDKTNPKGAVADITFYDEKNRVLPKPYSGTNSSKLFGAYFYITTFNQEEAIEKTYKIESPERAVRVTIKIVAFDCFNGFNLDSDYRINIVEKSNKKKESKYLNVFKEILLEASAIPDSNGSEYFTKHNYRVGVIGDIYMYNFYKDVFSDVSYLSPDNYQEVINKGLDIVIYTTCWKGINNEEWRGVKFREKPKSALDDILQQAKKKNIKTVFQTIEDPSNFEYFLPIAVKFEYVLTTDTDCIERYKEQLKHDRVFYGEYGVNPQFNNPIGSRRNIRNAAFFAGSYPTRYAERCKDMEVVFDSIVDSGGDLLIADRNYDADSEELKYPDRFHQNVLPPIKHDLLQKVHKLFRYNLNFNSIKQSPTMCAMRVYELQAQGNGLISNYANSVYNKFPNIRIIPFEQNMALDFNSENELEEYRSNTRNIREVLDGKTSYDVVSTLLNNIGLESTDSSNKVIAVICRNKTEEILASFKKQSYSSKILIEEHEIINWVELKERFNIKYFCWFSTEDSYEKNYLNDMVNGFKYTSSSYITKNSYFDKSGNYIKGKEHEYTNLCSGKYLSVFAVSHLKPSDLPSTLIEQSFTLDNGYSIDPFEVNYIAYMHNNFKPVSNYSISVIVPVYNNAQFLISKCIPSLQRNKVWSEMEVLLIDDGSTDVETLETLNYLESIYSNVKLKFNHGNGSGSASRPRNQGIDLAEAPIVTFLDPDNEISSGGYDLLIDLYNDANASASEPIDFISGFHVKVSEDVKTIGKHTSNKLSIIKDFKKGYFSKGRFPVIATQSAVISKKLLNDNNIRFVEGSAGQDTLFGWEMIANSKCGGFNGEAYIIYYADRSDSITNVVDKSYFVKKLILEREQKAFLVEHGLLESFMESRFEQFIKQWYLKKLDFVDKVQRDDCVVILDDICKIYNRTIYDYI